MRFSSHPAWRAPARRPTPSSSRRQTTRGLGSPGGSTRPTCRRGSAAASRPGRVPTRPRRRRRRYAAVAVVVLPTIAASSRSVAPSHERRRRSSSVSGAGVDASACCSCDRNSSAVSYGGALAKPTKKSFDGWRSRRFAHRERLRRRRESTSDRLGLTKALPPRRGSAWSVGGKKVRSTAASIAAFLMSLRSSPPPYTSMCVGASPRACAA